MGHPRLKDHLHTAEENPRPTLHLNKLDAYAKIVGEGIKFLRVDKSFCYYRARIRVSKELNSNNAFEVKHNNTDLVYVIPKYSLQSINDNILFRLDN